MQPIKTRVDFISNTNGSSFIVHGTSNNEQEVELLDYESLKHKEDSVGLADKNNVVDYDKVYIPSNYGNNKVPYFSQGKNDTTMKTPSWASEKFGGSTMEKSGCSITSFSMVLSYLLGERNQPSTYIYPDDVVQKIIDETGSRYTYHYKGVGPDEREIFPVLCDMYDLNYKVWTSRFEKTNDGIIPNKINESEIISEIRRGHPMICHAGPGKFTKSGHFIVVTGITPDGKLVVNDPNHASFSYEKFTFEELRKMGVDSFWEITK